jgi:WD40 repeat protein
VRSSVPVQVVQGVDVTQSPAGTRALAQSQASHAASIGAQGQRLSRGGSAHSSSAALPTLASVGGASNPAASSSSSSSNRPLTTAEFDDPRPAHPSTSVDGVGALADASDPTHGPLQARQAAAFSKQDLEEYGEEESKQQQPQQQGDRPRVTRVGGSSQPSSARGGGDESSVLTSEPVLALEKIIGYSASRTTSNLCWSPCGQFMLYPSNNVLVVSNVRTGAQEFLTGHTADINIVSVSSNGIVATGQAGRSPLIRLWNFSTRQCVAILMAHSSDLKCVCFSFLNLMLAAVGRDAQGRVLIVVWDVSAVLETGAIHVVAKQLSDYSINRLLFSPFRDDPLSLISVGHESIRFWRIKTKHLPGSSLQLNEHARNTFTAVAFESKYGEADHTSKRMYVATASGSLFQINYATRQLECIYKLHSGPIYSLDVNEGFVVTGAGDCFLRVWPLDFSDFYVRRQSMPDTRCISSGSLLIICCETLTLCASCCSLALLLLVCPFACVVASSAQRCHHGREHVFRWIVRAGGFGERVHRRAGPQLHGLPDAHARSPRHGVPSRLRPTPRRICHRQQGRNNSCLWSALA